MDSRREDADLTRCHQIFRYYVFHPVHVSIRSHPLDTRSQIYPHLG